MRTFLLAFAGALVVVGLSGCPGPHNDRLYTSHWRHNRTLPYNSPQNWHYPSQPWEQYLVTDDKGKPIGPAR